MSDNKTIARRVREEIWTKKDFAVADQILSADCATYVHDPLTPPVPRGPSGLLNVVKVYVGGFPDSQCTIQEIIGEGDVVAARWTARATHTGDLMGISPTGREVEIAGVDFYRFKDGKIVEIRTIWDAMTLAQQLGMAGMTLKAR